MSIDAVLQERAGFWRVKSLNLTAQAEDAEATADAMDRVPTVMLQPQAERQDEQAREADDFARESWADDPRTLARIEEAAARRAITDPYNRMGRSGPIGMELAAPYRAAARQCRIDAAWYQRKVMFVEKYGAFLVDPQQPIAAEDATAQAAASVAGRIVIRPGWYAELENQIDAAAPSR